MWNSLVFPAPKNNPQHFHGLTHRWILVQLILWLWRYCVGWLPTVHSPPLLRNMFWTAVTKLLLQLNGSFDTDNIIPQDKLRQLSIPSENIQSGQRTNPDLVEKYAVLHYGQFSTHYNKKTFSTTGNCTPPPQVVLLCWMTYFRPPPLQKENIPCRIADFKLDGLPIPFPPEGGNFSWRLTT